MMTGTCIFEHSWNSGHMALHDCYLVCGSNQPLKGLGGRVALARGGVVVGLVVLALQIRQLKGGEPNGGCGGGLDLGLGILHSLWHLGLSLHCHRPITQSKCTNSS